MAGRGNVTEALRGLDEDEKVEFSISEARSDGIATTGQVPDEWKGATSVVTPGGKEDVATLSRKSWRKFQG